MTTEPRREPRVTTGDEDEAEARQPDPQESPREFIARRMRELDAEDDDDHDDP